MCIFKLITIALFQTRTRATRLFGQIKPELQPDGDGRSALDIQPALNVQPVSRPVGAGEHHVLSDDDEEMRHR